MKDMALRASPLNGVLSQLRCPEEEWSFRERSFPFSRLSYQTDQTKDILFGCRRRDVKERLKIFSQFVYRRNERASSSHIVPHHSSWFPWFPYAKP